MYTCLRSMSDHDVYASSRCIPVRWKEGATLEEVEVLMITSSGGQGLVFPKVRHYW